MKFKLTHSQFMAIYSVLKNSVFAEGHASNIPAKLVLTVVTRVYKKFYNRAVDQRSKYNITLSPDEAMAFWLLYHNSQLEPTSFEGNLIATICNNIYQQYA